MRNGTHSYAANGGAEYIKSCFYFPFPAAAPPSVHITVHSPFSTLLIILLLIYNAVGAYCFTSKNMYISNLPKFYYFRASLHAQSACDAICTEKFGTRIVHVLVDDSYSQRMQDRMIRMIQRNPLPFHVYLSRFNVIHTVIFTLLQLIAHYITLNIKAKFWCLLYSLRF